MNKNQKILAASGGVIAVAVVAAGVFAWCANSAKLAALDGDDDGNDGLVAVQDKASSLSRKAVYPCAESVKAIDANATKLADWRTAAQRLAARGDRPIPAVTPAQFKTELVAEAKRIASLPGSAGGAFVKPDFAFGPFKPYLQEGKMPSDAELADLQRRWDDVSLVAQLLADAGATELVDVAFVAAADAAADGKAQAKGAKNKAKRPASKNKAKGKGAAKDEADAGVKACSYSIAFAAQPAAIVKAVNALGTHERFIVVESMTMARSTDAISEALGGTDKKNDAVQRGGRRGRRVAASSVKKDGEAAKGGVVTDPAVDAPFKVTLKLTVYDFGLMESDDDESAAESAAQTKTEEVKK